MKNLSMNCSFLRMGARTNNLFFEASSFNLKNFLININWERDEKFSLWMERLWPILHEKYHHLQLYSSTLGLFYCLCNQYKENVVEGLFRREGKHPPLRDCLDQDETWRFLKNGFYLIEYLTFWINGDFSDEELKSENNQLDYGGISSNQLQELFYIFGKIFNECGIKSLDINEFNKSNTSDRRNEIKKLYREHGVDDSVTLIQKNDGKCLGAIDILEGAARIIDLSKIDEYKSRFSKDKDILEKFERKLNENNLHSDAYDFYSSCVNIENIDKVWTNSMFLVLCDYAINIPLPLFDSPETALVLYSPQWFLPQHRFIHLLLILKRLSANNKLFVNFDPDELQKFEEKGYSFRELDNNSIDDWNELIVDFYEVLEKESFLPSPLTLAKEFLSITSGIEEKRNNLYSLNYFLTKFKIACQIRLECPIFICYPQIVKWLDKNLYLKLSNQLETSVMMFDKRVLSRENFAEDDVISDVKRYIYTTALSHLFDYEKIQISDIISNIPILKEEDIKHILESLFGNDILKYV